MDNKRKKLARPGIFESVQITDKATITSRLIFILLCMIPILSTILFGGVDAGTWILICVMSGAIAIAWLADAWGTGGLLISRSILPVPIAGLIIIGLVQLLPLGSHNISTEVLAIPVYNSLSLDPYATRMFLVRLVVYLVFLAAALTYINSEKRLKRLVFIIIIFGTAMAFYSILQRLAIPGPIYGLRETPNAIPFGPFVNQHHFAAFMELTGGLTFSFLFGHAISKDRKPLVAIAAVVMGVAAILTLSRGGLISIAATLVFVVAVKYIAPVTARKNTPEPSKILSGKIYAIIGGLALAVIILGFVFFLASDDSLFRFVNLNGQDGDVSNGRLHFWSIALKIFFAHPIFGAGFDSFGVAFTAYDSWIGTFRVEQAHNDYLQTLADAGIAGFLCVVGFITLLIKKGFHTIKTATDAMRLAMAVGSLAGCFGILIHSFFDFPLRTPSNAFFFLLLVAIATVSVKFERKRKRVETSEP